MREFIGHKLELVVDGFPKPFTAVMVDDKKTLILVKSENEDKIRRIPKGKICMFTPIDFEPVDHVPFHLLFCRNKETKCPGVKFVQEGAGVARADMEKFMADCPCRQASCDFGTHGEIRTVRGEILRASIGNTIYGEYPEKEASSGGDRGTDSETE